MSDTAEPVACDRQNSSVPNTDNAHLDLPPGKRPTLRDVAAHAGVSVSAVSKVLRSADGVSAEMYSRVTASIATLAYRPNAAARGLRGRTFTVGMVVPDLQNPFFGLVIDSIASVLGAAGYELFIGQAGRTGRSESETVEAMLDRQMDGLILMIAAGMSDEHLAAIGRRVPLVVMARHGAAAEYDTVASDDLRGSDLLIDHLVSLGHRRISHITYQDGATRPQQPPYFRELGYRDAMRRHGLEHEIDVVQTMFSEEGGRRAAQDLLARDRVPTAIYVGADIAAFGVLSALGERSVPVPAAISVVGYDNLPTAAVYPISLTTIDPAAPTMGTHAARLLLQRIAGRTEPISEQLAVELIVRATTAPASA